MMTADRLFRGYLTSWGMPRDPLRPLFWLLALFFLLPSPVSADDPSLRYQELRASYQQLLKADRNGSREDWLKLAEKLRLLQQAAPEHGVAPKALFIRSRLHQDLFRRHSKSEDLDQAIALNEELASLFPQSSLADDSLFAAAALYLADKKDPARAARTYAKVIALYPSGDMANAAISELTRLKNTPPADAESPARTAVVPAVLVPEAVKIVKHAEGPSREGSSVEQEVSPGPATLLALRHWSNRRYTRVVVETNKPVTFKHQIIEGSGDVPRRMYVDLKGTHLGPTGRSTTAIEDGLLRQARSAQFDPETVRVVLDTQTDIADYKVFTLSEPFRVVIDVMSGEPQKPALTATALKVNGKEKVKKEGEHLSLARQLGLGVRRIVIDPGHGGKDPGAVGPGGLKEKDVVLDLALRLAKRLKEGFGCEVILTRNRDIFVPLEERTAIANSKEADLFLSIHVNAAPNLEAKGIETYVLDLASNPEAMRVAALENSSSARQLSNLQSILQDLMQNTKINESLKLAGLVQEEVVSGLSRSFSGVNNLGVKKAPFVVLIGAQMPAILVETAFISNQEEEKRLRNEKYLAGLAEQIASGVGRYIDSMSLRAGRRL